MEIRVAAYAVVERRGKLLLTHWRRGHLHGWTLPGGGLEPGEDPRDAVVREVFEETGLEARVTSGLVRTGDLRLAAKTAGVAYEPARKSLKSAMRKMDCHRQADLMGRIVRVSQ